jgi:hypothetical protein
MTARYNVRAADDGADRTTNNSTGRTGNYRAGASANRRTFKRAGLSGKWKRRKCQDKKSGFYDRTHIKSPR